MIQYVVCNMSTGSRRYQVPHLILPHITRCPALFSRIFFPAFNPLSLPHPAFYPQPSAALTRRLLGLWHTIQVLRPSYWCQNIVPKTLKAIEHVLF